MADVPERLQRDDICVYDEEVLSKETEWIYTQLTTESGNPYGMSATLLKSITKADISRFLKMHHIEKFEVPFIARYRKDECRSLLKEPISCFPRKKEMRMHMALWLLEKLSRNWRTLQRRKKDFLCHHAANINQDLQKLQPNADEFVDSIIKQVDDAQSDAEMDDIEHKLQLSLGVGIKIGGNENLFDNFLKPGLWELASKFGCFVEYDNIPEQLASILVGVEFPTIEDVLTAARQMAAFAISCDPHIRKFIRSKYLDTLVLSTSPKTHEGTIARDIIIEGKPLHMFDEAQWFFVQKAEEENLIDVTFELPKGQMDVMLSELNSFYHSNGTSQSAAKWNEHRKLIVHVATYDFLLPLIEKEARLLLIQRAKCWLLIEYRKALWSRVSTAPVYDPEEDRKAVDARPPILACCWGADGSTLVMLDKHGQLLEELSVCSYSWESYDNCVDPFIDIDTRLCYLNDVKRVVKFLTLYRPYVSVIGAVNMSCILLRKLVLKAIASVAFNDKASISIRIVYGDESLARLYEHSQISSDQLPGKSGIVKRAVALGRYIQNPLAMIATLCGQGREIVHWNLLKSPVENCLTLDEKYEMIERVMVDVTNQVGFNINLARYGYWYCATLQFISGLGPTEAARLQQSLANSEHQIGRRTDLLKLHKLGKKLYANAVGFLGVWPRINNRFVGLMDGTRIHPESYSLARELVKEACRYSGVSNCRVDICKELRKVNIETYAKSKELQHKMQALIDIRNEFLKGFSDPRGKYRKPSDDEQFYWITGLTDNELCEGLILDAKVQKVYNTVARFLTVDYGLMGKLKIEDYSYSDGRCTADLKQKLKKGDIISCTIKSVKKSEFLVYLNSLN